MNDSVLAILAFHKIGEPPGRAQTTPWYIPEATFRTHLHYLSAHGWEVISVEGLLKGLSEPESLPRRAALLTFDDGYKSLLGTASRCLNQFGYPSVAFVSTRFVGKYNEWDKGIEPREAICTWDELRELERRGCSIQSHGVGHRSFENLAPQEQEEELRQSKSIIEAELGKPVEVFAYPYGEVKSGRSTLNELLKRIGYRAACLCDGKVNRPPWDNDYSLARVTMFPDSDIPSLLSSRWLFARSLRQHFGKSWLKWQ
jgi:peptidoglycan/xylan/chitin deacetylase (PgdA/CDA1 family)